MPRTTKDSEKNELNKKKTSTEKATTATQKATSTKSTTVKKKKAEEVKPTAKVTNSKAKKVAEKKVTKTTTKRVATTKKKTTSKATSEDKTTTNKVTSAKSTNAAKKTAGTKTATKKTSSTRKKSTTKKLENNVVAEYYDLPYRYNETIVKILYQTPTILFVYWDISDYDRENYIKQYGQNFFNNTRPVLKIYNLTKDYNFEVEINDYANSWYINVNDANCEYRVELIRRTIKYEENLNTDYIYVSSSNEIEFPNDHILLDELPDKIRFKNIKTNQVSTKDISTLHLIGINKIYNVYDFYKTFYKNEIAEINANAIINPSSSSWK